MSGNGSTLVSAAIDGSVHVWRLASKAKPDLNSNSESSSRKTSIVSTLSVASKTETSVADFTKKRAKIKTTRNSVSEASLQISGSGYRDVAEYLRPLNHLWRPDLAYTMEESHFFFEG